MTTENASTKLYNITGTLSEDVAIKSNSNGKSFALAHVQSAEGRKTTVMTYVKAGIDALTGKKAGDAVRLFGTYVKGDKGQTFSAMGISPERPAATEAATA